MNSFGLFRRSKYTKTIVDGDQLLLFSAINLGRVSTRYGLEVVGILEKESFALSELVNLIGSGLTEHMVTTKLIVPVGDTEDAVAATMIQDALGDVRIGKFSRRVSEVRIVLTEKCNMACDYCFVTFNREKLEDNELRLILQGLERLVELNLGKDMTIQFFGGEPMLKFNYIERVVEFMEGALSKGRLAKVTYKMTTNMTIMNERYAGFLRSKNFNIVVSIDGWKELHDRHRLFDGSDASAFERTKHNLSLFSGYPRMTALMTITDENADSLAQVIEYLVDDLSMKSVTINMPEPGPFGWNIEGKRLATALYKAREMAVRKGIAFTTIIDYIEQSVEESRSNLFACVSDNHTMVTLAPNGKFSACKVDWWIDDELTSIDKPLINSKFVDWKMSSPWAYPACDGCIAMSICGGPCPIEAHFFRRGASQDERGHCNFFRTVVERSVIKASRNGRDNVRKSEAKSLGLFEFEM